MGKWSELIRWLRSPAGDFVVDEAVMGSLPAYEAEEILGDYGIPATRANLGRLGREIDAAARDYFHDVTMSDELRAEVNRHAERQNA